MVKKGMGIRVAALATLGAALALSFACSSTPDPIASGLVGRCKRGTLPCGNGCMPVSAACCDDGTRRTSGYCTNSAGGGCRPNPNSLGTCKTPKPDLPGSAGAVFCCAGDTLEGSFDCLEGEHHCGGPSCVPIGQPCCADDALAVDCPTSADSSCPSHDGVLCGVTAGECTRCPMGSCCASDPLKSSGFKCLQPTGVCTGTIGSGSSSSGGGSCKLVWDCGSSSQCAVVYGGATGSAAEPDAATCAAVCKMQGACTCQGC